MIIGEYSERVIEIRPIDGFQSLQMLFQRDLRSSVC